jgi:ferredoxin
MADFVIERGLAREVTREEAGAIVEESEKAGLVHFVDNAQGKVKHNCNCCGCSCWNVGSIRRRKIPRDVLMATYFLRETEEGACLGCGACAEICPVVAVTMEGEVPVVDRQWCIGCGVCAGVCPAGAVQIVLRTDRREPPQDFQELHERILREKGYREHAGAGARPLPPGR